MGPYLFLLILIACGEKTSIEPGKTTRGALVELKGEPLKSEDFSAGEVLTYEGGEKFQINQNLVSAHFRNPEADESRVLFWKHKFRDCDTSERALSDETIPEIEFACAPRGESIIYLKNSGLVLRVTKHAKP